jgi:hypothetical protein
MPTVLGIMDGGGWAGNTDIVVVADPERKLLRWIPRDLWCDPDANLGTICEGWGRAHVRGGMTDSQRKIPIGSDSGVASRWSMSPKEEIPCHARSW